MKKILFVCHGNICRSPMAEFVMKHLAKDLDLEIASAATSTEEIGNPVYPPVKEILAQQGISCKGKRARQMTYKDYEYYDFIVVMDKNNLRNLRWILPQKIYQQEMELLSSGKGKISMLMDWAGTHGDVADPWYTGDFETTFKDVNLGCSALLKFIKDN